MVFSTAFGTAIFGYFIDSGLTIETISLIAGTYVMLTLFLLILISNKINPIILKNA